LLSDVFRGQDGIMIGAKRWRKYLKPYLAKMYAKIYHMCGSEAEMLSDLIDIGLDV